MIKQNKLEIIKIPYLENSAEYFESLYDLDWPVYIDSCHPYGHQGRYDIISAAPTTTITTYSDYSEINQGSDSRISKDDPFTLLNEIIPSESFNSELPFVGGAIGYFSYDLGRWIETLDSSTLDDTQLPQMSIGIYDWAIVIDHQTQTANIVTPHFDSSTKQLIPEIINRIQYGKNIAHESFSIKGSFQSNFTRESYGEAFEKIKNYIYEGDCYQVNLSQRFLAEFEGSPWLAYRTLREHNPAPYSAFLSYPHGSILSCSPERFLNVTDHYVTTKPMKGTRPRGKNENEDELLANELLNSAKDHAENLMIVDLLRNDLGKTCIPGTIKVPKLCALESFPSVHHLVSTVIGKLSDDKNCIDLFKGCFPGGSITGAPKIRSMEIIEELESHRRNIYCGSIGYISYDGKMDSNIAIRTLLAKDNKIYCSAGGAIVSDSNVDDEYQETFDKVNRILKLLN